MKKRYAGGIGVILVLGFIMGQLWRIPGLGTHSDEAGDVATENSETNNEDDSSTDYSQVSVSSDLRNSVSTLPASETAPVSPFVTVAIQADKYRLTDPEEPQGGEVISLEEVVELVKKASGSDNGIRLRVLFYKNAQEGAVADLHAAMASANIPREDIQEISDFVD
ncbi:hypothetical protein KOR42_31830 [Thalassoglobus neptunius]|uniref:Uncharacterized protein n=1 Tax=Thalassoglobus neptunius TaxID=1938619 RepID=A0A5C5WMN3_9PLAN|nr:hypothetical protein [Thalassoglobus neptunius]TWT52086.1 hypothetical protein KOR42_31830 [Thalassoglobus neptunius]